MCIRDRYSWTNDNTNIGLAASGDGNIPSFTSVNTSFASIVSNITVTPSYTNNGITCVGPSESFTITVNPTAQVEEISSQILCAGEPSEAKLHKEQLEFENIAVKERSYK